MATVTMVTEAPMAAATVVDMAGIEEDTAEIEEVMATGHTTPQAHTAAATALAATITAAPLPLLPRASLLLRRRHRRLELLPLVQIMRPSTRSTTVAVLPVLTPMPRTEAMLRESWSHSCPLKRLLTMRAVICRCISNGMRPRKPLEPQERQLHQASPRPLLHLARQLRHHLPPPALPLHLPRDRQAPVDIAQ